MFELLKSKRDNFYNSDLYGVYRKIRCRFFPLLNTISFLTVVAINIFGSANSTSVANISDKYPTCLTPAGSAFSIWGLIYTLQTIWILSQFFPFLFGWDNEIQNGRIGLGYVFISILNIIWILLFVFEQLVASFVIIFLFWLGLAFIYFRIDIHYVYNNQIEEKYENVNTGYRLSEKIWTKIQFKDVNNIFSRFLEVMFKPVENIKTNRAIKLWEYLIIQPTFSIYFSWLSGATILCLGSMLNKQGYSDTVNGSSWSVSWLIILSCFSILIVFWRKDFIFSGTFTWTSAWIAVKQTDSIKLVATSVSSIIGFVSLLTIIYVCYEFFTKLPKDIRYILFNKKENTI